MFRKGPDLQNQLKKTGYLIERKKSDLLFYLSILIAVILRLPALAAYYDSYDEGVYLLASTLVARGKIPYKDFFLAHFPAQEYLLGTVFWISGSQSLLLARMIGLAFVTGTGIGIYFFTKMIIGKRTGMLATVIFFYNPWTILWGRLLFKEPFTAFFALLSCHVLLGGLRARDTESSARDSRIMAAVAGMIIAVAMEFKITAACVLLATAVYLLIEGYKQKLPYYLGGFIFLFSLMNFPFVLFAGEKFIEYTILFHLYRPADSQFVQHILVFITQNFSIVILTLGMSAVRILQGFKSDSEENMEEEEEKKSVFPLYWLLFMFFIYSLSNSVYYWYFYLLLPPVAILAGQAFVKQWDLFKKPAKAGNIMRFILILFLMAGMNPLFFLGNMKAYEFEKIYVGDDIEMIEELVDYIQKNTPATAKMFSLNPAYPFYSKRPVTRNIVDPYGYILSGNLKGEQESKGMGVLGFYLHSRQYNVSELLYMGYTQEKMEEAINEAEIVVIDSQHGWFLPGWTVEYIEEKNGQLKVFKNKFITIKVFIKN
ncbi:MAG: ArnT family glycosyltransferase [Candidatus Hodarchaeales archaeon]